MADTNIVIPSPIDAKGNLKVHGRDGLYLKIQLVDAANVPLASAATLPLFLEIDGVVRKPLADGAGVGERILIITPEEAAEIGTTGRNYIIKDESRIVDGVVIPEALLYAKVSTFGFTDEPPEEE